MVALFLLSLLMPQVIAVVPLALYIILFEYIVIQSFIHDIGVIFLGILSPSAFLLRFLSFRLACLYDWPLAFHRRTEEWTYPVV
jgi:hypothetical protein